jgi:hypothetical protein
MNSGAMTRYLRTLAYRRPFKGAPDKSEIVGTIRVTWRKISQLRLDRKFKLDFDYYLDAPGVYRISVTELGGVKHEYIGETGDLKRRFSDYRHPKTSHAVRVSRALVQFLLQGATIQVELVDVALVDLNGIDQELDLYNSNHRKFVEYFVLSATWAEDVTRLNR